MLSFRRSENGVIMSGDKVRLLKVRLKVRLLKVRLLKEDTGLL